MFKFLKSEKFQDIKYNIIRTMIYHQNILDVFMGISRGISGFAKTRSPLSFIEGGVSALNAGIKAISGESHDFFSIKNGWTTLVYAGQQQALYDILISSLDIFPSRELKFAYESNPSHICKLPIGMVAKANRSIFYREKENNKEEIIQFLLKEKIKANNSKIFSITERQTMLNGYLSTVFNLEFEDNVALPSKVSDDMAAYLKNFLNNKISRSIILNGMPGVGKTSLSYQILQDFGFNVLKIKCVKNLNKSIIDIVPLLIKELNIEGVLLDDFDYSTETGYMLEFIEYLHRHCKIIIAITNSLKSFPPAMLRPGRFDEIKTIECLDDQVIKNILGTNLYDLYIDRIKKWPIAYINELIIRINNDINLNVDRTIEELQNRIDNQFKKLSDN